MNDEPIEPTTQPSCADEEKPAGDAHAACSRRSFLDRALPVAAAVTAAGCLPRIAFGRRRRASRDTIVVVFLRGGMDGLNACVPYGDADYYNARKTIAIPPPGSSDGAIDLDGYFGLAPALAGLTRPYQDGRLAVVHATGSTDPTRSHFDAERHMETGLPDQPARGIGWLSRHMMNVPPTVSNNPLRAAALEVEMPYTLLGAPASLPVKNLTDFDFIGDPQTAERRKKFLAQSFGETIQPMSDGGINSLASFDLLAQIDFENYVPANGALYPSTSFGKGLKSCSALLKADLGTEALMLEVDEFDTHASQSGILTKLLKNVGDSMAAFYLDNLQNLDRVVMVVMSEFGRRVRENGSHGTDHGHGNCMLVMGGHVHGGQVLTHWPTLEPSGLDDGDLPITIDYRDILSEILAKRMECSRLDLVFPNYTPTFQGIIV